MIADTQTDPSEDYANVLACYRSGQMSYQQWVGHCRDPLFWLWVKHQWPEAQR